MIKINIISATPGISTQEQILQLIQARHTGITIKEINKILNRPISMIQVYLKDLVAAKAVVSRENRAGVGMIYYPSKNGN
ncbi:winged helix-turn-helix domain-containing protein [Pleurocapsales cyanobacterium LEGE 10410]|nr:winged helix-turn-helix domain-containing protein [Pleurocapsales cyanobacterium LEGE 10410]